MQDHSLQSTGIVTILAKFLWKGETNTRPACLEWHNLEPQLGPILIFFLWGPLCSEYANGCRHCVLC